METIPTKAVAFASILILIGIGCLSAAGASVAQAPSLGFYVLLLAGVAASGFRLSLPTVSGTISANFLFVLIGLTQLTIAETTVVAAVVTLIQCLFAPPRKPRLMQVAFNIANVALASQATGWVHATWHFPGQSFDLPLRTTVAAVVYFVLNTMPVSLMISLTEKKSFVRVWTECFRWSLPYYLSGALLATAVSSMVSTSGWLSFVLLGPFVYLIFHYYKIYVGRFEKEKSQAQEIADLHSRTIEALALAIEAKDQTSQDHLYRLRTYCVAIGEEMGLRTEQLEALRAAAMLHDIGKLAVPEHILLKPGKLSREEFEKIKIHPGVGAEILDRVRFPYPVAEIVRHHHEKWNGGGYPDGLAGENIPVGARILAVVDTLDALTAGRSYRAGSSISEAIRQIVSESGISFDPKVVELLERHAAEYEERYQEEKSNRPQETTEIAWNRQTQQPALSAAPSEPGSRGFLSTIAAARQEAQTLFELAQELGKSLSLDETLSVFAVRIHRAVPYDTIAIYVRRESILRPEYVAGEDARTLSGIEMAVGQGLSGWVAENRKPVLNGNPLAEPGYRSETAGQRQLRSALSIPLEGINGVTGVISLYSLDKDAFSRDHLRILQAICGKVAISIENALKYRQAESSASTDYLTGLLNARSLFLHLDSELARCRRLEAPLAILVSDLDGFKQVNDRFGHLEGNRLLQRVAQRLKESCREYDCVARMGGDEFVLVLPGLTQEAVRQLVPRLRDTVKQAGREVLNEDVIGFSVGEAYFPRDGEDAEQLLAAADKRMYQVKAQHKLAKGRGFDFDQKATVVP